jgi:hypothetical protein
VEIIAKQTNIAKELMPKQSKRPNSFKTNELAEINLIKTDNKINFPPVDIPMIIKT